MKRALEYGLHLILATFAVPWLTIMAAGLAYGVLGRTLASVRTPQQFYSNYLMFFVVIVGALLAYAVSDRFTNGLAQWVWIPFTIVFLLRILDWRASGSVLIGSGSFVEHFFTVDCQIENWREGGFASRCSDKLFLTPLFIGSLSYSAGAAIHLVIQHWHHPKIEAFEQVGAVRNPPQLVTTRFGAFLALALTGGLLGLHFSCGNVGTAFLVDMAGFWIPSELGGSGNQHCVLVRGLLDGSCTRICLGCGKTKRLCYSHLPRA